MSAINKESAVLDKRNINLAINENQSGNSIPKNKTEDANKDVVENIHKKCETSNKKENDISKVVVKKVTSVSENCENDVTERSGIDDKINEKNNGIRTCTSDDAFKHDTKHTLTNLGVDVKNSAKEHDCIDKASDNIANVSENKTKQPENVAGEPNSMVKQPEYTGKQHENTDKIPENTGKQPENTDTINENTGNQSEIIAKQPENTGKQLENTTKQLENTGKKPENTSKKPENTGKQLGNKGKKLENTGKLPKNSDNQPEKTVDQPENAGNQSEIIAKQPENIYEQPENIAISTENTNEKPEITAKQSKNIAKQQDDMCKQPENTGKQPENIAKESDISMTKEPEIKAKHADIVALEVKSDDMDSIAKLKHVDTQISNDSIQIHQTLNNQPKLESSQPQSMQINTNDLNQVQIDLANIAPATENSKAGIQQGLMVPVMTTGNKSLELLSGNISFNHLPPLPKKTVRIFISSTFTDTKEERNALMQNVYPQLSDYCREKFGLEFQVVDMRWGVPEQASDNHSTSELCIQEIKKCKEVSAGPNFVALIGDKYGYRPIPSCIEVNLFQKLQDVARSLDVSHWEVVEEWYRKDENSIPAVYILQSISSKIQHFNDTTKQELRKEAQNEWNQVNQCLMSALRSAADKACTAGSITAEDRQAFFMSVTENEITEGVLLGNKKTSKTCFCIIRRIKDLTEHTTETVFPRFADVTPTKEIDTEAQDLLKQLREAKLEQHLPQTNLMKLDIEWTISGANMTSEKLETQTDSVSINKPSDTSDSKGTKNSQQQIYLEQLCSNFKTAVTDLIDQGGIKEENLYDDLSLEVLQHWHLAKKRCELFEGREDLLKEIEKYVKDEQVVGPMIVHGCSGSGKTSVMAKVVENITTGFWLSDKEKPCILIPRFLGTTTHTSNVHQLLVSLCTQLAQIIGEGWKEPEKFRDLIESFSFLISKAATKNTVIVLLDSIDQLMPAYNAFKLKWLPEKLNTNVKIIVSTINEGYSIYEAFKSRYKNTVFKAVHVKPLGETLGLQVISKWLSKDNRNITDNQRKLISEVFSKCSLPLFARIMYDQIIQWKSFDKPMISQLETTVRGAIDKLLVNLEEKFGVLMVKHSIGYLTAARNGLSETELDHILSLDDILLNDVFRFWNPPIRRIPPLLWTRIRNEIHSYIVERSADDTLVMAWYHRQFIEATKAKYLSDQTFRKYIHGQMVDFFIGKWGGGKQKPFEYTTAQVTRFNLKSVSSMKDRKVPQQAALYDGIQG